MKRYDLSKLMHKAWSLYRKAAKKAAVTFSEALKTAWVWIRVQVSNNAMIEAVAQSLGIEEEFHSWAGWQSLGRMVIHTEEATFKVEVSDPTTKKGTRVKCFFLYSQTQPAPIQ